MLKHSNIKTLSILWLVLSLCLSPKGYTERSLKAFERSSYPKNLSVFSVASAWNTDEVEYYEVYFDVDQGLHTVYISPDGNVIAERWVVFQQDRVVPLYRLVDYRHGFQYGVDRDANQSLQMFSQQHPMAEMKTKPILADDLVVDTGFDHFILEQWQPLFERGEKRRFTFPFAKRRLMVGMKLQARQCQPLIDHTACLALSMKNPLFSIIAGKIQLRYQLDEKRLVGFDGLSPLASEDHKPMKVRARFEYVDTELKLAALGF